jgi:hypothetical protein
MEGMGKKYEMREGDKGMIKIKKKNNEQERQMGNISKHMACCITHSLTVIVWMAELHLSHF